MLYSFIYNSLIDGIQKAKIREDGIQKAKATVLGEESLVRTYTIVQLYLDRERKAWSGLNEQMVFCRYQENGRKIHLSRKIWVGHMDFGI
jgi:hypothetical protein